jgi:hypothetical protein
VASDNLVLAESWRTLCTCPGAAESQAEQTERDQAAAERKQQTDAIFAGIDTSRPRIRDDLRAELEAAYSDQAIEPNPYELDSLAGGLEAIAGPKHLQGPRILGVVGRLITQVVRDVRKMEDD